jgi:hypothetical protein
VYERNRNGTFVTSINARRQVTNSKSKKLGNHTGSKSLLEVRSRSSKNPRQQFGSEQSKKIFTGVPLSLGIDLTGPPTRMNKMDVPQDDNTAYANRCPVGQSALQRGTT